HDAALVRCADASAELARDGQRRSDIQASALAQVLAQVHPLEILADQVRQAARRGVDVQTGDRVRVRDGRSRLRLALKSRLHLQTVGKLWMQHFDRNALLLNAR